MATDIKLQKDTLQDTREPLIPPPQVEPETKFHVPLQTCCCGTPLQTGVRYIAFIDILAGFFELCLTIYVWSVRTNRDALTAYSGSFYAVETKKVSYSWVLLWNPFYFVVALGTFSMGIVGMVASYHCHLNCSRAYAFWKLISVIIGIIFLCVGLYLQGILYILLGGYFCAVTYAFQERISAGLLPQKYYEYPTDPHDV